MQKKWQKYFAQELTKELARRRENSPKLSLRKFASEAGLSAGGLSEILKGSGRWNMTEGRALQSINRLQLEPSVLNRLTALISPDFVKDRTVLTTGAHSVFANKYHLPILFSLDLKNCAQDIGEIATLLKMTPQKVETLLTELTALGLVRKCETTKKWLRTYESLSTVDGERSESQAKEPALTSEQQRKLALDAVIQHHLDNADMQKHAILEQRKSDCDFTTLTFAGNRKKIDSLREEIRALHAKAAALMDNGQENDAVFRFSVQVFPVEF